MWNLAHIGSRLRARPAASSVEAGGREAAVAVVLREGDDDTEMLFIQRAERAGDPWSGHMAFPGGHRDPEDADLPSAAVRETFEEVGLDLSAAPMLGALPEQRPMSGRRKLVVFPFVFAFAGEAAFSLNHEVAAALWSPLAPMHRGESVARLRIPFDGPAGTEFPRGFNGFRLPGGHFVWGLTYRMVQAFFESIDPHYRRLPD